MPPPSTAAPPLAAHKALTVLLFRVMLLGDEVQGSPHRAPAPAAWAAGRAYLLILSLPGAGAYGVLQPALVGVALTNMRSWSRNSAVHRSGGVSEQSGGGDGAGAEGGVGGKKKGAAKRRRAVKSAAGGDTESEAEESGGEAAPRRRRGQKAGTGVRGGRGGGGGGGEGASGQVLACLRLLKACMSCVPLTSHQVCLCVFACAAAEKKRRVPSCEGVRYDGWRFVVKMCKGSCVSTPRVYVFREEIGANVIIVGTFF